MTENKPVAWVYESTAASVEWRWYASPHRPEEKPYRRNILPVYRHPPAPQPDPDPAVEAARRKALRAVLRAVADVEGYSDIYSVRLAAAVLRDLVGNRPDDTRVSVSGYDEPAPRLTSEHLNEFARQALKTYAQAPPARLSVDMLATIIRNRAGLCLWALDASTCTALAQAVQEAIYGKDV